MKKSVKNRKIKHRDFKDCLFDKVPEQRSMMGFKSDCHQIFTQELVSSFSDSRAPILLCLLVTKPLVDLFLILGVIAFPIFVDSLPVVFTVLSSVISDVFLVLLTIGSLAADESLLVNFIPSFRSGFGNLDVLCSPSFLPG